MANYDLIGDIAIVKFPREISLQDKKIFAKNMLSQHKNIKTVLEKVNKVSGRLRTIRTKFIAGARKKVTLHKESGCVFKVDIEKCYFSPRLSSDRIKVASLVKKSSKVLCLFSGIGPYPIIISKYSHAKKIIAVELGRECNRYAKENINLNKIKNLELVCGDVKKVLPKLAKSREKFDFISMNRPNLNYSFLKEALMVSKKGTRIYYHGFSPESKKDEMIKKLEEEAKAFGKKIKLIKINKIGDIAPYEHRYGLEMVVL